MNAAMVRKLALALPHALESSHFNVTDFRVGKKIFATIHPGGKTGVLLRLDPDLRASLAANGPDVFLTRGTALQVVFAKITAREYRVLLEQAWRAIAPRKLVAASGPARSPVATRARR